MRSTRKALQRLIDFFYRKEEAGMQIPPLHGIAWADYYSKRMVTMLVPFNIIAHFARGTWAWLRFGFTPIAQSPRDAYMQGYEAGKRDRARSPFD